MPKTTIKGRITPTGHLHIKYAGQTVEGTYYGPYDIVIMPKDEDGSVSFEPPQGIVARIEGYPAMNYHMSAFRTVKVPGIASIDLDDLVGKDFAGL